MPGGLSLVAHIHRYLPLVVGTVFRHADILGIDTFRQLVFLVGGFQVQPFTEVPFHQFLRCHDPVEVSVQALTGSHGGHLGVADLSVKLVLPVIGSLFILLLVHVELLHGDASFRSGYGLGHPERFFRHLGQEFGRIIAFHQLWYCHFLLLEGGKVGCIHPLGLQLLAVYLGGEVPLFRVCLALVRMTVSYFFAVCRHHLRLSRHPSLLGLGFLFTFVLRLYFGFLLLGRFLPGSVLHCLGRLFLQALFLFLFGHICMI